METQNNNLQELEELRSQVAEFKNRMEQQEIVSCRLLKEAMKGHVSWIKQMSFWGSVAELLILPLLIYALRYIAGFPWLPIIAIGLVIAGEAAFNLWNVSTIRDKHLAVDDVLSVQQRLITFKRRVGVFNVTDIPFPSSERLVVYCVLIVITTAVLSYVFCREMRSQNKAIRDIDEFAGKE